MATLVNTGSQSSCSGATSLTTSSASATAGNKLVLAISWLLAVDHMTTYTPGAISGWTLVQGPTSARNATYGTCGVAIYHKTAAGGVESPVFTAPDASNDLYAHGIITEWSPSGTWSHDTADSSAVLTNNTGGASTGDTIPSTGTLAQASSVVISSFALFASTGLANANFAFSGGGYSAIATDNNTSSSVGTLIGYKTVSATTAVNAVLTWTSDSSIACYQGAIAVFSDTVAAGSASSSANVPSGVSAMGGGLSKAGFPSGLSNVG